MEEEDLLECVNVFVDCMFLIDNSLLKVDEISYIMDINVVWILGMLQQQNLAHVIDDATELFKLLV